VLGLAAAIPLYFAADRIRSLQRESDALAVQEKTLLVELRALETLAR